MASRVRLRSHRHTTAIHTHAKSVTSIGSQLGAAFENFLLATIKALAYLAMEDESLLAIKKYESGERFSKYSSAGYFHDRTWGGAEECCSR
ncbi:MAG: hypothetical protein ABJZ55_17890 [Fuerstiella sp.]